MKTQRLIALVLLVAVLLAGCDDANMVYRVKCYSFGKLTFDARVRHIRQQKGGGQVAWFAEDAETGQEVRFTGDCNWTAEK